MKPTLFILLIFLAAGPLFAQPIAIYSDNDREIFQEYLAVIEPYRNADSKTLLEKTALFFLDKPYVAHTLEGSKHERLTVCLQVFDCTTYVETILALAMTVNDDVSDFETFMNHLKSLRYRNGCVDGYDSRIHYATDWLYENEKRGVLHNLSKSFGGKKERKSIDFMSTHRDLYKQIADDDTLLKRIVEMENNLNKRGGFYYLPKAQIKASEARIPHMSVVLFTTSIKGLDVTHMGFAYRKGGKLTFLHASDAGKKVMIDELTLDEYTRRQRNCSGIVVVEVNPLSLY